MALWRELVNLKDCVIRIFRVITIPDLDAKLRETMLSGFQLSGGASLIIHAVDHSLSPIWLLISSGIAINGIRTGFRILGYYQRASDTEQDNIFSAWVLGNTTAIYMAQIWSFSDSLKIDDKAWILHLVGAAIYYCFAVSSINSIENDFSRKKYLKCSQKLFEPALITITTIYLLYFQNHQEEWLHWLPFAIIATTGIKTAYYGYYGVDYTGMHKSRRLRWIEIMIGGCSLIGSSTVLAIYFLVNNFHKVCFASMICSTIGGFCVIYSSFKMLLHYLHRDILEFYTVVGMSIGPLLLFPASVLAISVGDRYQPLHWCQLLVGTGVYIFLKSMHNRYLFFPRQEFYKTCRRVLGPVMTVHSSLAAAYVYHRMGWQFSLPSLYFIFIGINATYRGFKRPISVSLRFVL